MDLLKQLESALSTNVSITDKNVVTVKDIAATWETHCPVAKEEVTKLHDFRSQFAAAYHGTVGKAIVEHVKANPDVETVSHKFDSGDVEFGFDFTRPTSPDGVKLTKAAVRSTMAARVTVTGLKASDKAVTKLVDIWDF